MRIPLLRSKGIMTSAETFRVSSLCLYSTLLLHLVMAVHTLDLALSQPAVVVVGLLAGLFLFALTRYARPDWLVFGRAGLLIELGIMVFIIANLTLQQSMPPAPLP